MAKLSKKTKMLKPRRKARTIHPHVVSFRLTLQQEKNLKAVHERDSALGVKTPNQFARKIVCDFLAGRISYKNPEDRKIDLEA